MRPEAQTPFICWVPRHGRSEDLAEIFGWKIQYVYPAVQGQLKLPRRYAKSIRVSRQIQQSANDDVALMLPPPFLALTRMRSSRRRTIFDIHSGLLTDRRWRPYLKATLASFRKQDLILAHNESDLAIIAPRVQSKVLLLQDPALTAARQRHERSGSAIQPSLEPDDDSIRILFPSSGDTDEPLERFAAAAEEFSRQQNIRITVTGRSAAQTIASQSILTPGFLPQDAYESELRSSEIIVALSTRPDIVQRAAFEAVVVGARPVVSESAPLRRIFGEFAEYVNPNSGSSIQKALQRAAMRGRPDHVELAETRGRILKQENEQIEQASELLCRS